MSCSPAAMRATALRRISSLTGTERHPDARSSPKVVGRGGSDMGANLSPPALGRTAPSLERAHVRCQVDRPVPVEGRLQPVGDVTVGPQQRVAGEAGVVGGGPNVWIGDDPP